MHMTCWGAQYLFTLFAPPLRARFGKGQGPIHMYIYGAEEVPFLNLLPGKASPCPPKIRMSESLQRCRGGRGASNNSYPGQATEAR